MPHVDPSATPDPTDPARPTELAGGPAELDTDRAEPDADPTGEAAPMSRAERRAAARGKAQPPKVAGPAAARLRQPPPAKRNYAARKGG